MRAVLTGIAHHEPSRFIPRFIKLLYEFDMAPVEAVQIKCVVVTVTIHSKHTSACRQQAIPLFAGYLTGFTTNTNGCVSEKSHAFSLHTFSTLQTKALAS
jgi:hypothetical protein